MKITVFLLFLLLLAPQARGESAIQCHCFQDRSFDAAHPEKVERYLLATSQNSLLGVLFGVDKAQVVGRRMSGARAEDLWVAFSMAARKSAGSDDLLAARRRERSWRTALLKSGIKPTDLDAPVAAAFKGGSDLALANAVADESIARRLGTKRSDLADLRARGATTPELALAALLAKRCGRPAPALWWEVKEGKTSWGLLTAGLGLDIGNMEKEFAGAIER